MEKEKLLQQFLDGDLSDEQEREALHIIAEDSEMREMLSFERNIRSAANEMERTKFTEVPPGFTDQVMHRIEQVERQSQSANAIDQIKKWIQSLWIPQTINIRPVYGMAMGLVLLIAVTIPFYAGSDPQVEELNNTTEGTVQQASSNVEKEQVWVRFVYIDENAESIEVAGDFNNWDPVALEKQEVNGEQVWTGLVSMNRGEHSYMFVKDGEKWLTDPMASVQREDGFGNKNAVIYL
ncbi:MAG: hypothetical protein ACQEST_08105 [Bacteroidota bacterium]